MHNRKIPSHKVKQIIIKVMSNTMSFNPIKLWFSTGLILSNFGLVLVKQQQQFSI